MKIHKPPANDAERLENLRAGLALLDAEDDQTDEEFRAEAEAAGIDFEAWAAEMRARVQAHGAAADRANDVEPPPRRARRRLVTALAVVSLTGLLTLGLARWQTAPPDTPLGRRSSQGATEESAPPARQLSEQGTDRRP